MQANRVSMPSNQAMVVVTMRMTMMPAGCRSAMESLRKALEEEAKLASVRREEDAKAMREAVDTLREVSLGCGHTLSWVMFPPTTENSTRWRERLACV